MKQNLFHIADASTRMKIYVPTKMNKGLRVGGVDVVTEDGVWTGSTTNIKGVIGPTGDKGQQPDKGTKGSIGSNGEVGLQGLKGLKGLKESYIKDKKVPLVMITQVWEVQQVTIFKVQQVLKGM